MIKSFIGGIENYRLNIAFSSGPCALVTGNKTIKDIALLNGQGTLRPQ